MPAQDDPWIVVVSPAEPVVAERMFEHWARTHPLWSSRLGDADIRIDTIRSADGKTLRRYCVRAMGAQVLHTPAGGDD